MNRRCHHLLVLLFSLGVFTTPSTAQENNPQDPVTQTEEATLEERFDSFFKEYFLDPLNYLPFGNVGDLLGIDPSPKTKLDDDDDTIWATDADGNPVYELDEETGAQVLDDGGQPIRVPEYELNPQGNPAQTKIPAVVLWLVIAAVFFTFRMGFVNLRLFRHAIDVVRGKFTNPSDEGEVTHFQALSSALSATVGLGNIAGVAIAVSMGGPGATFWMIVAGLLGMTLKFTECTLGQMFRKIDETGQVSGGPMHYLKEGLEQKGYGALGGLLSVVFIVFCIGGSVAGGNAFQVNQSLGIVREQIPFFQDYGWVYGLIMAVLVGIVIIGGIKRIAQTAEKIVPLM
jgi:hypothetical protein